MNSRRGDDTRDLAGPTEILSTTMTEQTLGGVAPGDEAVLAPTDNSGDVVPLVFGRKGVRGSVSIPTSRTASMHELTSSESHLYFLEPISIYDPSNPFVVWGDETLMKTLYWHLIRFGTLRQPTTTGEPVNLDACCLFATGMTRGR